MNKQAVLEEIITKTLLQQAKDLKPISGIYSAAYLQRKLKISWEMANKVMQELENET